MNKMEPEGGEYQYYLKTVNEHQYLEIYFKKSLDRRPCNIIKKRIDSLYSIWDFQTDFNLYPVEKMCLGEIFDKPRYTIFSHPMRDEDQGESYKVRQKLLKKTIKEFCKIHGVGNILYEIW